MDFVTAVGLIGSLLTIEEAGRSWGSWFCGIFKKKCKKKQLIFFEWDTGDESTQRIVDAFKCDMQSHYKEHIFQSDEVEKIADEFLKEKHYLVVDYNQEAEIRDFIRRTFAKYNEYTRFQMTLGERVLQDSIEGTTKKVENIAERTELLLKKDEDTNFASFRHAVHLSKTIKLENIDNKINGEYEIDRTELLTKIRNDGNRFISVQGNAGCGKSGLCKSLVCKEAYLLMARAEELVNAPHLRNVWDCDLQSVFQALSDQRIVIYIDALEFIADYSEDKLVVLQELYDIANDLSNVYIVTSCRTTDRNAFIKLQTKYSVETYEVGDITESELDGICNFYPVINELRKQHTYSELLKSPFYINLVVSNGISTADISDENTFREYIWKNIICLNRKAASYGIDSSAIYSTVNTIVFERAKKFLLGVRELDIHTALLKALSSEGIVTVSHGLVRLKYDIFEDICFEQYFDREFEESRGNLEQFYGTISSLGRCVFRRYQIWIANKLFVKENRSKFIYKLIFTSGSDPKWKKQTEIGIVKSKYCGDFFREYTTELEENKLLDEFLDIINLYAFEVRLVNRENGHDLNLIPVGKARDSMIQLIYDNSFFCRQSGKAGFCGQAVF